MGNISPPDKNNTMEAPIRRSRTEQHARRTRPRLPGPARTHSPPTAPSTGAAEGVRRIFEYYNLKIKEQDLFDIEWSQNIITVTIITIIELQRQIHKDIWIVEAKATNNITDIYSSA